MKFISARLLNSTVAWSWAFNALRLAGGLILLPLILHKLPTAELGMYYVFLSLVALVPIVDFGFGPTIGRFVSYAMGGADHLQAQGIAAKTERAGCPNYTLLWELLITTRYFYRFLAVAIVLILGTWGTYMVELRIHETASPGLIRVAWALTVISSTFDIYANWWAVYLRGMNQVLTATRILLLGQLVRLSISAGFLFAGAGLMSIPLGTLAGSLVQRTLERRRCLRALAGHPQPDSIPAMAHLRLIWPNSWRLGLQLLSGYLTVNANTAICLYVLGLAGNAKYGLSIQLMNIAAGMAAVWTAVKWPVIGQYRALHEYVALQKVFRQRFWLQNLSFLFLGAGVVLATPFLLQWSGTNKAVLAMPWFALLGLNTFLEMQFSLWSTLISTENRLPFLRPAVATNILSLILSSTLILTTDLGLGALVLGPLLSGSLFNYWYWAIAGAKSIRTRLIPFLLNRPEQKAAAI